MYFSASSPSHSLTRLLIALVMKAARTPKTSEIFYQITRCQFPHDSRLHIFSTPQALLSTEFLRNPLIYSFRWSTRTYRSIPPLCIILYTLWSNHSNRALQQHHLFTAELRAKINPQFSETEIKHHIEPSHQRGVTYCTFLNSRTLSPCVNMATTKGWNETTILETTPPSPCPRPCHSCAVRSISSPHTPVPPRTVRTASIRQHPPPP
jgi:hypothetical protein